MEILLETVSKRHQYDTVCVTCRQGEGIRHTDLAKLFKPHNQLDSALARRLAELHGGAIEVASEPGKGSTFTLRLPIREDS